MFQIARAIKKYKIVHTGANIQSGGLKNGLFNRIPRIFEFNCQISPVKDAVNVTIKNRNKDINLFLSI